MLLFQMYSSVQFHIASKCTNLPTYQVRQKPVHAKSPCSDNQNVWHMVKTLLKRSYIQYKLYICSQKLLSVSLSEYSVIKREI